MSIQWFPGHMHRARKQIAAIMPTIDVVIEVLDARLPIYSENPMLAELRGERPCLKVLNKSDLADPVVTAAWKDFFQSQAQILPMDIVATDPKITRRIISLILKMGPKRNLLMKPLLCLVIGIPNVGKSTLMNTLVGRKVARTANQAAITTKQKRVHLSDEITLYDTPGVLWPKIDDPLASYMLAGSGAMRETAMDNAQVAVKVGQYLMTQYSDLLSSRYGLKSLPSTGAALLEAIGQKRGCLLKGAEVDLDKAATILLNELRSGKIGRISLQKPSSLDSTNQLD